MAFDIKQIIPCNVEMWAVYREDDGSEFHNRVIAFALGEDGYMKPLEFDAEFGIDESGGNLIRYEMGEDHSIADSIHSIAESLEDLTKCISVYNDNHQFSITGDIMAYETRTY